MDALSEVLKLVRLGGAVFLDGAMTAPWAVRSPPSRVFAAQLALPHDEQVIEYHLVVQGSCWIRVGNDEPLRLEEGDLAMLPHGEAHVLSDEPHPRTIGDAGDMRLPPFGEICTPRYGGGGALTRLACGYLALDPKPCRSLLAALPRVLRIDARDSEVGGWLRTFMRMRLVERSEDRPGGASVLGKLSELMFVEAIRRYVETLPEGQSGWLAALRDPFVGKSLALIHASPAKPWSVEGLARAVGLARSSLAERFTQLIGQPPMQYLTQWRLTLAGHLLQSTGSAAALVAEQVGYDSEAAFSRAFKREFGMPPAAWRRGRNVAGGAGRASRIDAAALLGASRLDANRLSPASPAS